MTALDYILEGLEKALEVERECGARAIEIDRALLVSPAPAPGGASAAQPVVPAAQVPASSAAPRPASVPRPVRAPLAPSAAIPPRRSVPTPSPARVSPSVAAPRTSTSGPSSQRVYDFVFLHDRPLSPDGRQIVEKTLAALKRAPEDAPVVVEEPLPKAKVYVVMGYGALHKWFPGVPGTPGTWFKGEGDADVLVNYSPEYIIRFGAITPKLDEIKRRMWDLFKSVAHRFPAPSR